MALTTSKTITNDIGTGTELIVTIDGTVPLVNDLIVGISVVNTAADPDYTFFLSRKIENPGATANWTIPNDTTFAFSLEGFPLLTDLTISTVAQYIY
jgi:hypothetical protein